MHNNKKASAKAGQKKTHAHFPPLLHSLQDCGLTTGYCFGHDAYVPETEGAGFGSPNNTGGCSALLAVFLRPTHVLPSQWRVVRGSLRACRSLCSGLPTLHAPATHLEVGSRIETANTGVHAMRKAASGTLAHITRFSIYRLVRHFAGPALAYRLSFAGRAA